MQGTRTTLIQYRDPLYSNSQRLAENLLSALSAAFSAVSPYEHQDGSEHPFVDLRSRVGHYHVTFSIILPIVDSDEFVIQSEMLEGVFANTSRLQGPGQLYRRIRVLLKECQEFVSHVLLKTVRNSEVGL